MYVSREGIEPLECKEGLTNAEERLRLDVGS